MDVAKPRTTICTGEKVPYTVAIRFVPVGNPSAVARASAGDTIEGYVDDPRVGAFVGTSKQGKGSVTVTGSVRDATFTFVAGKKPGQSRLQFQALIEHGLDPPGYVSFEVPIKVVICKYRVSATFTFPVNFRYNPDIPDPPVRSFVRPTVLASDSAGNFTGSGTIRWRTTRYKTGLCKLVQEIGRAHV